MVIRQEYANARVKSIDVDFDVAAPASEHDAAADRLVGELLDSDASLCVAYRNGQRWVQTYERVVPGNTAHRSPFRQGGVYLITGGLGKIGVAISAAPAARYRARLAAARRSRPRGG